MADRRVLNGDHGNYLIPVKPSDGYAEVALCEPWACVEASYLVQYRTQWKDDGVVWLIGNGAGVRLGQAVTWKPRRVVLDVQDGTFADQVRSWAHAQGIEVVAGDDGESQYDDIVVLGGDARSVSGYSDASLTADASTSCWGGRWIGRSQSISGACTTTTCSLWAPTSWIWPLRTSPVRTQLKEHGVTWVLGAAGPMGQMHFKRALSMPGKPRQDHCQRSQCGAHGANAPAVRPPGDRSTGGGHLPFPGSVRG